MIDICLGQFCFDLVCSYETSVRTLQQLWDDFSCLSHSSFPVSASSLCAEETQEDTWLMTAAVMQAPTVLQFLNFAMWNVDRDVELCLWPWFWSSQLGAQISVPFKMVLLELKNCMIMWILRFLSSAWSIQNIEPAAQLVSLQHLWLSLSQVLSLRALMHFKINIKTKSCSRTYNMHIFVSQSSSAYIVQICRIAPAGGSILSQDRHIESQ
jgi:hypothetical protein